MGSFSSWCPFSMGEGETEGQSKTDHDDVLCYASCNCQMDCVHRPRGLRYRYVGYVGDTH